MRRLIVVALIASAGSAHAFERPRPMGMYIPASANPFAMLESRIDVTVRGPIVETLVVQRYQNPTDHATEATYIFPLPVDAAVSAMSIQIGARTIRAAVEKRDDAQRRYEAAVAAGVGAGVLDEERPDIFTQTVAAIPAHGIVEVSLRYDTVARFGGAGWELVLPMVVAPRYVPGTASGRPTTGTGRSPDTDRAPDASRITPSGTPGAGGSTAVAIHFLDAPADVTSPTHEVAYASGNATFSDPHSDHDSIIRWRAPAPSAGWIEKDGDAGFAAVVVEGPPATAKKAAVRFVLAVDRSATVRGDADVVQHPFVRTLLGTLDGADRVRSIGNDSAPWGTPADTLKALERVWSLQPGVFDLTRALAQVRTDGAPIVLVTDGLIGDDRAALAAAKRLGVPIHVIGVGPAPARGLLAQLAGTTGGTVRYAVPGDDLALLTKNLTSDLASPPAPVTVNWGTLAASDVEPAVLPRLGAGQAMLVLARIKRVQAANARVGGALFAFEALPGGRGTDGSTTVRGPLARRWARDRLGDMIATGSDRGTITTHAMTYGLVSPYTSLVAVGTDVVVQGGVRHSVAIPVSVPAGMQWATVKKATTVEQLPVAPGIVSQGDRVPGNASREPIAVQPEAPPAANASPPPPPAPTTDTRHSRPAKTPDSDEEPEAKDARKKAHRGEDDADADKTKSSKADKADEGESIEVTGAAPRTAMLDRESGAEELVSLAGVAENRKFRYTAAVGGGVAFDHGTAGLLSLDVRLETNRRTLLGLEGALWLVGGNDAQGRVLVTLGRRGIANFLEFGVGLGAHFGDGSGVATSLRLRANTGIPHLAGYLRYDNAALVTRPETEIEHALTFGLELSY